MVAATRRAQSHGFECQQPVERARAQRLDYYQTFMNSSLEVNFNLRLELIARFAPFKAWDTYISVYIRSPLVEIIGDDHRFDFMWR